MAETDNLREANTLRFEIDEEDMKYAGEMLKEARAALMDPSSKRSVSLRMMAEECNVSRTLLFFIEDGRMPPAEWLLPRIAKAYQVSESRLRLAYAQPSEEDQAWLRKTWEDKLRGH